MNGVPGIRDRIRALRPSPGRTAERPPPARPGRGLRRAHLVHPAPGPDRPRAPRHRPAHGGRHPRPRRAARLRAAAPRGRRAGQDRARPRDARGRRARPRARPARRAGPARVAAQPLQRRLRAPRGDERQGPLPRAPRPDAGRLPRDQPRQGLQPALRRLLRELGRPPREARLGDLRAHGARGARHLGHPRLRDQRRRAARVARRGPLRARPRRALPGLLLRDVHERDADRRRGREADGPARQRQPRPLDRGDEGAHRREARRRRLRQGPRAPWSGCGGRASSSASP